MGAFDPAVRAEILAGAAGVAAFTSPSTLYLAATKTTPTDDTPGTELDADDDPGYARCTIAPGTVLSVVDGVPTSTSDIVWTAASGDWSDNVEGIEAYDADSGGDRIWYHALDTPVSVTSGKALRIPAGDLTINWAS
jgi:hypothetical protein